MSYKVLKNKVVVVTGGAGFLGEAFINGIVNHGGIGIIADLDENRGRQVLNKILSSIVEGACEFVKFDMTDKKSIVKTIGYLKSKYGKIDALVNSAYPKSENYGRKFEDVEYKDFCKNVNLHLGGYFLTSQQFALFFKEQGYGNIVNISSIYGVIPPRFEIYVDTDITMPVEYACIKSAIIQLTKYMAKYFKGYNIRINSISPGGIYKNQPKNFVRRYNVWGLNKGMLDKEDIVGTLIFLLSDMSQYINGQNIIVDDGWTL